MKHSKAALAMLKHEERRAYQHALKKGMSRGAAGVFAMWYRHFRGMGESPSTSGSRALDQMAIESELSDY